MHGNRSKHFSTLGDVPFRVHVICFLLYLDLSLPNRYTTLEHRNVHVVLIYNNPALFQFFLGFAWYLLILMPIRKSHSLFQRDHIDPWLRVLMRSWYIINLYFKTSPIPLELTSYNLVFFWILWNYINIKCIYKSITWLPIVFFQRRFWVQYVFDIVYLFLCYNIFKGQGKIYMI